MSDLLPPVVALLVAETSGFSSGIGSAISDMGKLETATGKLAAVGKAAFLGLGVAAAAIGTESVKLAMNFDQQMELIHTQAGASQAEVDALKNSVLALAPTVGMGPEALAEGLYHVESAGFRGQAALDILAASAKTAAVGQSDLEATTQALIGTMAVGFTDVTNAADAGAYLNTIVGIGDMRMNKLADSIATGVLPSFKAAGLGMADYGAGLATLTDNVTPADEAATRLRMTVALLGAPSGTAAKALTAVGLGADEANKALAHRDELAKYGIHLSDLSADLRKPDGLLAAVMDLKKHLEASGLSATEQAAVVTKAFGGGKTSGAILTLMEESDRLKSKYDAIGTAGSRAAAMQDAWASQQKQFSQQLHQLGAEAQVLGVKIGNVLIPVLQGAASWLSKHIEVVKIASIAIGGILVAAIGSWTAAVVANTVAMLANPTTWIVLGIVAAVALLSVAIYELVKHWHTVWKDIKEAAEAVWHWLVDAWHATVHALSTAVEVVYRDVIRPIVRFFANDLVHPVMIVLRELERIWSATWHVLSTVASFFYGFFSVIIGDIVNVVKAILIPQIQLLEAVWNAVWDALSAAAKWTYDNVIHPVFDAIVNYGVKPVQAGLDWLGHEWLRIWGWVEDVFDRWWKAEKIIFGYVYDDGIKPLWDGLKAFGDFWKKAWDDVGDALKWVYDHTLKPIFDAVSGGLHDIGKVLSSGSSGGAALAHMFGFAEGGPVPGSPGEPMLAIVHGGEFVLSRDMISSMRSGGGIQATSLPSSQTSTSGGGVDVQVMQPVNINLGDQRVGTAILRVLIPAAQQQKARSGVTGLA